MASYSAVIDFYAFFSHDITQIDNFLHKESTLFDGYQIAFLDLRLPESHVGGRNALL